MKSPSLASTNVQQGSVSPLELIPGASGALGGESTKNPALEGGGDPSSKQVHQGSVAPRLEPVRATKFASTARPSVPDFSGWNWVPQMWSRSMAALMSPP